MQSGKTAGRSETLNSMVVLEQGRENLVRPQSGRRSVSGKSPLKRGGSSLEILPADEENTSTAAIRLGRNSTTSDSPRLSQSAGSPSRLDFTADKLHVHVSSLESDRRGGAGFSSSNDGRRETTTPDSPRRQVNLTTVRRNFEQHGMPKNEELARAVQSPTPFQNGPMNRALSPTHRLNDASQGKEKVQRIEQLENSLDCLDDTIGVLERLTLEESAGHRSKGHEYEDERTETDSYYISHSSVSGNSKVVDSPVIEGKDDYYLSHKKAPTLEVRKPPCDGMKHVDSHADHSTPTCSTSGGATWQGRDDQDNNNDSSDDDDSDGGEEDEKRKAPFQLMGEFLESVMEEDYENAEKLCKMVLLYEPDNAEAKQFQPLIEEMLKRERAAQLWGSESDDSESDSSEDDNDSDSDAESDEDEEDSSSSEEQEDEDKLPETTVEK